MATVERGEFTLEMLKEFRNAAAQSADRGDPHGELAGRATAVYVLKELGRVKEALVEGAALFPIAERYFPTAFEREQNQTVVGLRSVIAAAIARPEVAVSDVEQSIVSFEQLCERAQRPSGAASLLRLELRSTLDPTEDLSTEMARLKQTIEAASQPLLCGTCLRVRMQWFRRRELRPRDVTLMKQSSSNCLPERGWQVLAEHQLHKGNLAKATSYFKTATAKFPSIALPLSLVCTGLALAEASRSKAKVAERLVELERALKENEYPYDAFEALLLVERARRAGLVSTPLPERVTRLLSDGDTLASQLDVRSPKTNAMERLSRARKAEDLTS